MSHSLNIFVSIEILFPALKNLFSGRSKCKAKNGSKAKKCAKGLFQGDDLEECTDLVETGANVEVIEKGELRAGWSK